ncbi:PREDICTED: endoglin [Nipponia nippon]|uniref:endoglin n=1 Tax=Nipponia nippon TaxID=128390 RepID=UPI000510DEBB|nr:PREDICTED: endoglin [Nipponia nippon]
MSGAVGAGVEGKRDAACGAQISGCLSSSRCCRPCGRRAKGRKHWTIDPGRAEGCDLQPVTAKLPITLSYATSTVPRGCVSSSSTGTDREVHILSVKWSKDSAFPLQVSVTPRSGGCTHSVILILLCAHCSANVTSPCKDLLIHTDALLFPGTTATRGPELPTATGEGQLLAWARDTYRSITSYSELRDPRWVQLHLGEGTARPLDCIPQENFNATLHLETEVFFHGVKGCSRGDAQSTRAAHIVRLQPEPSSPITEVNLSLSCPERTVSNQILILQSWANFTWSLSVNNNCHIQFLVSGNYRIAPISSLLLPGERLPDTEQGLIAKAFEKNYSVIASYSTIPASTHVSLEIQEHEVVRGVPVTPAPPAPTTHSLPHVVLLMLQPWKCTDETMEIVIARSHLEPIKDVVNITLRDISCQAEKNATHFMLKTPLSHCGTSLEGRGHANNELILNLAKGATFQSVRVRAGSPSGPRGIHAVGGPPGRPAAEGVLAGGGGGGARAAGGGRGEPVLLVQGGEARGTGGTVLEGPPSSHGRKVWRFRFTYAIPEGGRIPFSATLKCKAGLQVSNNTIFEKVLEVTVKDSWRPPNNRGLGLAAVLGITFGAFLIGALLTAGLWYIYSHTREPRTRLLCCHHPYGPPGNATEE